MGFPFSQQKAKDGVSITKGKIVDASINYNVPNQFDSSKTTDVALELSLEIGKDFTPKVYINGNFKRGDMGDILGIGSAFKIEDVFNILNIDDQFNLDGTIPPEALTKLLGRDIYKLDYVGGQKDDGKLKWKTWDTVDTDPTRLRNKFFVNVAKGYPRNFQPNLVSSPEPMLGVGTSDSPGF